MGGVRKKMFVGPIVAALSAAPRGRGASGSQRDAHQGHEHGVPALDALASVRLFNVCERCVRHSHTVDQGDCRDQYGFYDGRFARLVRC